MGDGAAERAPPGQTFELFETVRGKRLNTLQGLALHREVLSPAEQLQTLHYVRRLKDLGDDGALLGRTYSAPRKWMKGKGRVTVQLGCCYNYARDKNGNPPGILPREPVCGLPNFFEQIIDRMCRRGIFNAQTRCVARRDGRLVAPPSRPLTSLPLRSPTPLSPSSHPLPRYSHPPRTLPCALASLQTRHVHHQLLLGGRLHPAAH